MKSNLLVLAATVSLFGITACIAPVKYQKSGVETPSAWQHVGSSGTLVSVSPVRVDQDWWHHFGDPTLDAIIEEAIRNNKSLAIAKARVEEVRAARGIARSALMPQINGVASGSRGNFGVLSNDKVINQGQAGFDATWELDLFGGNQARSAQAAALYQSAQAGEQAVLVGLLAEVARNYFDLRNYERQIALTQENLINQKKTYDVTTAQFTGAIASDFDVQRAGAQVSQTQSQIPTLQTNYEATLNRLNVLLGYPPGTKNALFTTPQELKPLDPQILVAAPALVLTNRPDVRAAERQLAASISGKHASFADFFPHISLLGFYGVQTFDHVSYSPWDVGADAVLPLLNFGRLRSQYKVASARQQQAFYNYQQVVLEALENMEDSLSSFLNEYNRNQFLNTSVVQNRKAEDYANQQFTGGFTDLLDLLIAQQTRLNAESRLVDSDASLRKNLVNIYTAAGGGWNTELASKEKETPQK